MILKTQIILLKLLDQIFTLKDKIIKNLKMIKNWQNKFGKKCRKIWRKIVFTNEEFFSSSNIINNLTFNKTSIEIFKGIRDKYSLDYIHNL